VHNFQNKIFHDKIIATFLHFLFYTWTLECILNKWRKTVYIIFFIVLFIKWQQFTVIFSLFFFGITDFLHMYTDEYLIQKSIKWYSVSKIIISFTKFGWLIHYIHQTKRRNRLSLLVHVYLHHIKTLSNSFLPFIRMKHVFILLFYKRKNNKWLNLQMNTVLWIKYM
jgi:hypothetical protein